MAVVAFPNPFPPKWSRFVGPVQEVAEPAPLASSSSWGRTRFHGKRSWWSPRRVKIRPL